MWEGHSDNINQRWGTLCICFLLAAATWIVFAPTLRHEFVNYDDNIYVYDNPEASKGLTPSGVAWAFTRTHASNWHPITWISHMIDVQVYGLKPGGHHLTNLLLHATASILLFLVLLQMTGAFWRCAFVAAVFAVHPLHVESVAWISERKDILSAIFFMLTLGAYTRYVRRPFSRLSYLAVSLFFALGLMSKPSLVTLPCLLLLLDYWPLRRFPKSWRLFSRLLVEKIPLFLLSAASCIVTVIAQEEVVASIEGVPISARLSNAAISYLIYLGQTFYPNELTYFYPYPIEGWPLRTGIFAMLVLAFLSLAAWFLREKRPWLFTGWFWYLGMLVPMIGIVQVGEQAHADRYTYLPQIGISLIVAWSVAELCARWPKGRPLAVGAAIAIILAMILCARIQVSYWKNSETLWTRALDCTSENSVAHNNLGIIFFQKGEIDKAITHYEEALVIEPDHVMAHANLANALSRLGETEKAFVHYQKALDLAPESPIPYNNLAWVLATHPDERVRDGSKALKLAQKANRLSEGKDPIILDTMAAAYAETGNFSKAIEIAEQAMAAATAQGKTGLAETIQSEMSCYQAGKPFHESDPEPSSEQK